ncbi:acylphosphatase [Halolamina sediminis]|jgi:acylphosphatase|uniref:acylphosphatase n=1 Tax=Halolamina sediminis TaxID=1480675 RepID=UPI0006B4E147|nr:acylphosphatase [Halolamina sediminis]
MSDSDTIVRAHVHVSGNVQGVAYRANTEETATKRGVNGWVRNREDGRVEAVFEGDARSVESMVGWCHTGSPRAEVERVEVTYEEPRGEDGFHVRWSG